MSDPAVVDGLAARLLAAEAARAPIDPIAAELDAKNVASAYAVQAEVTRRGLANGRRLVGQKIGLTSKAVRQQLGVDQPDYGALFADMEVATGGEVHGAKLIQPRIEAEIAIVLDRDLQEPDVTMGELMRAVAYTVPALEIVDSRIRDWKITILDTVADNGSSARFVLGAAPKRLTDRSRSLRHDDDPQRCDRVRRVRGGLPRASAEGRFMAGSGNGGRRRAAARRQRRPDGRARAGITGGGRRVL
jgi:2-keto-4-pentenoate hydratase